MPSEELLHPSFAPSELTAWVVLAHDLSCFLSDFCLGNLEAEVQDFCDPNNKHSFHFRAGRFSSMRRTGTILQKWLIFFFH